MTSIGICVVAFVAAYWASRRALWQGIAVVLATGYAYGIVRALVGGSTHLLFDAAVAGLFAGNIKLLLRPADRPGLYAIKAWTLALLAWPTILFFFAPGDLLVELVGWRANVFLLPCLLIGAYLDDESIYRLALVMAVLNIAAGIIAAFEFAFGFEMFFPYSDVTDILYRGRLSDEESIGLRIPSSFVNAHVFGGTVVMTLPFLLGAWLGAVTTRHRRLLTLALGISLLCVFVAGARTPIVVLGVLVVLVSLSGRLRGYAWMSWASMIVVVAWVVSSDVRLQRFVTLQDTTFLSERLRGSVNSEIFDMMAEYPLGRGLAGGGTSIPYFLQDRTQAYFVMENEFARIVLEQGIPGLILWLAFIFWVLFRSHGRKGDPWFLSRRLAAAAAGSYFALAMTGIGLLTAVPQSLMLLLAVGWVSVGRPRESTASVCAPRSAEAATIA